MSDAEEDLEALFDEVSSHRQDPPPEVPSDSDVHNGADALTALPPESVSDVPLALGDNEKLMFGRLGGIVRTLHDSLRELGLDKAIATATDEMSNAKDRLEYIATLTEKAANKVLNTLDQGMPEQETLAEDARTMEGRWEALFAGKLSVEEFKTLASDTRCFSAMVAQKTDAEKARLLDIMLAQDFQDITGQIIKKVVTVTTRVETELAQLLLDHAPEEIRNQHKVVDLMEGPAVPTAAMGQDAVDDLLAELGF